MRTCALIAALLVLRSSLAFEPALGNVGVEKFYVGTYSGRIYLSSLNLSAASFGSITQAVSTTDPSFLALSPDQSFLYSVNEGAAAVSAFAVNSTNGTLKLLNQRPSNGGAPAHIVLDRSGRNVIVANYNGGSVTVFPIQPDGKLGAATAHIQHPGAAPHAHCVTLDLSNHFAFVCDKGLDQIRSYIFDPDAGTLTSNSILITPVAAGSGPRHMVFSPDYKRAYVICELASTIIGFNYDSANGILTSFQTISTLPSTQINGNTAAEVAVHPSGKFLYGSNRGYNTIAAFAVDTASGLLTPLQQQPTGVTPRNFAVDPTGAFCIVACQDSNDIRLYRIDEATGMLTDTGKKLSASSPVCILPFVPKAPELVLEILPGAPRTLTLSLGNTLSESTYGVYHASSLLPEATWTLLGTLEQGRTNIVLTNSEPQEYFRAGILTNR